MPFMISVKSHLRHLFFFNKWVIYPEKKICFYLDIVQKGGEGVQPKSKLLEAPFKKIKALFFFNGKIPRMYPRSQGGGGVKATLTMYK